jgi:hypothetical protein
VMLPAITEDRIARERITTKHGAITRAFFQVRDDKLVVQVDGLKRGANAKENEANWTAFAKRLVRMVKEEFGFIPGPEELRLNRARIHGIRRSTGWTQAQLEELGGTRYLDMILANEAFEDPDLHDVHISFYEWTEEEERQARQAQVFLPRIPIYHLRNHQERLSRMLQNLPPDPETILSMTQGLFERVVRFVTDPDGGPADLGIHTEGELLSNRVPAEPGLAYDLSMDLDTLAALSD